MSGKKPKRSSKNLKINTRIVLTTVLAIAIPLVLVALVCLGLLSVPGALWLLLGWLKQSGCETLWAWRTAAILLLLPWLGSVLWQITALTGYQPPMPHRWRSGAWRWKFDGVTRYFIEAPGARMYWGVPGRSWPLIRKKMCTTSARTGW